MKVKIKNGRTHRLVFLVGTPSQTTKLPRWLLGSWKQLWQTLVFLPDGQDGKTDDVYLNLFFGSANMAGINLAGFGGSPHLAHQNNLNIKY